MRRSWRCSPLVLATAIARGSALLPHHLAFLPPPSAPSLCYCRALREETPPSLGRGPSLGMAVGGGGLEPDLQSSFGRGADHLSAFLDEGDVVAYQTGTWTVDGVEVGDGSPPAVRYALVDTIQLVWTHNCEHGVIRGLEVEIEGAEDAGEVGGGRIPRGAAVAVSVSEFVEFGPEQLLASLPVEWSDGWEGGVGVLQSGIPPLALSVPSDGG